MKPVTIKIEKTVEYCSECPLAKVIGPYWNDDFEEDDYRIKCTVLDRIVHEDMTWNEVAAKCTPHTNCLDTIPKDCPFRD